MVGVHVGKDARSCLGEWIGLREFVVVRRDPPHDAETADIIDVDWLETVALIAIWRNVSELFGVVDVIRGR
jgi:hypothetical protein